MEIKRQNVIKRKMDYYIKDIKAAFRKKGDCHGKYFEYEGIVLLTDKKHYHLMIISENL